MSITTTGYRLIPAPDWWAGVKNGRHVREHQVVYCEAYNLKIVPEYYVVHHLDHDKLNNKLSNLVLMEEAEHGLYHSLHRKRDSEYKKYSKRFDSLLGVVLTYRGDLY